MPYNPDRTLLVRQDIARLVPIAVDAGTERVQVEFRSGPRLVGRLSAPALGGFSRRDVMQLALDSVSLAELIRSGGLSVRPDFWLRAALAALRLATSVATAKLQRRAVPLRSLRALAKAALGEAALGMAGSPDEGRRRIASLIAEGKAMASRTAPPATGAQPAAANGTRNVVQAREQTDCIPVLLYHRIADEGPSDLARYRLTPAAFIEQMGWLRRQGYRSVTSTYVLEHLAGGRPFEGRPVMISFDDAYSDFHDVAWPILRAHDFTAEVFVVTDRVGGRADWDIAYGSAAPLMDWPQIQSLSTAGVRFGSHMASHSHMADLSSREIVLEAARSRAALERALDLPCRSIAAPFGEGDDRFVRIARQCGYEAAFTIDPGHVALGQDALRLPRIEVLDDWSLDTFVGALRDHQPPRW